MRQADLKVDHEYAFVTYKGYGSLPSVAQVRLSAIDGGGRATVKVIDPGEKPKYALSWKPIKRGEKRQVQTRDIYCLWSEWPDRAAALRSELAEQEAQRQTQRDEEARRKADRVTLDPNRGLPDQYDEEYVYDDTDAKERAALVKAYMQVDGMRRHDALDPLHPALANLPLLVMRDILSRATLAWSETAQAGTVGSTFERAARLLHYAQRSKSGPNPSHLIAESDLAFVAAICDSVAESGGQILLPPVPPMPDWVRDTDRLSAPVFGWLRLAVGDTTGSMLHQPDCYVLRGNSRSVDTADHLPWWHVMLEDPRQRICGVCHGPGIRDVLALAGFLAAADVWDGRGRDRIEQWQVESFYQLLHVTYAARVNMLEPDVTLLSRIVTVLSEDTPGEDGWHAYALLRRSSWNDLGKEFANLSPAKQEAARSLTLRRLSMLESALPQSQRPLPLPRNADTDVLRERYLAHVHSLSDTVPRLDRLLFTLPGAY
jgi:hypothetical protein